MKFNASTSYSGEKEKEDGMKKYKKNWWRKNNKSVIYISFLIFLILILHPRWNLTDFAAESTTVEETISVK